MHLPHAGVVSMRTARSRSPTPTHTYTQSDLISSAHSTLSVEVLTIAPSGSTAHAPRALLASLDAAARTPLAETRAPPGIGIGSGGGSGGGGVAQAAAGVTERGLEAALAASRASGLQAMLPGAHSLEELERRMRAASCASGVGAAAHAFPHAATQAPPAPAAGLPGLLPANLPPPNMG
eukprot:115287-Pleurochrysis_carterae.AAC.1